MDASATGAHTVDCAVMSTTYAAIPPMNKIAMIVLWIETLLYGINCVMYARCMSVLLRKGKDNSSHWVLPSTSTMLFLLCTVHAGASLQQLLDAFVYAPANVPDYSSRYWLDPTLTPRVVKDVMYCALLLAHHVMLTWRLYVVFLHDWRVVVIPIILLAGGAGSAYASLAMSAMSNISYASIITPLGIIAFSLMTAHNVIVTLAIVIRLWWVGRKITSLTGAFAALFCTVFLALIVRGQTEAWIGVDILAQLDALVPFLLVLQVAHINRRYSMSVDSSSVVSTAFARNRIIFRSGDILHEEDSLRDNSHDTMPYRTPSLVHDVQV